MEDGIRIEMVLWQEDWGRIIGRTESGAAVFPSTRGVAPSRSLAHAGACVRKANLPKYGAELCIYFADDNGGYIAFPLQGGSPLLPLPAQTEVWWPDAGRRGLVLVENGKMAVIMSVFPPCKGETVYHDSATIQRMTIKWVVENGNVIGYVVPA